MIFAEIKIIYFINFYFYAFIIAHLNFHSIISSNRQVMMNKAKREQSVALKTDDVTKSENVKQLKVCRKSVYNARK